MPKKTAYRCASCGREFEIANRNEDPRCPECRSRTLIVTRGEPRRKRGKCTPSG